MANDSLQKYKRSQTLVRRLGSPVKSFFHTTVKPDFLEFPLHFNDIILVDRQTRFIQLPP